MATGSDAAPERRLSAAEALIHEHVIRAHTQMKEAGVVADIQAADAEPEARREAEFRHQHEHLSAGSHDPGGWRPFIPVAEREQEHEAAQLDEPEI